MLELGNCGDYLNVGGTQAISSERSSQHQLYLQAVETLGAALERLARAYEADPDKRRDLIQDIHFQLWRSFERFDGRCSLRTWTYRIAHNTAASHVMRERRAYSALVGLEDLDRLGDQGHGLSLLHRALNLERLETLIQRLKPLDRQVIVSYLEDLDAASIAEITGLLPANVAMKIHRIKRLLARWFSGTPKGDSNA